MASTLMNSARISPPLNRKDVDNEDFPICKRNKLCMDMRSPVLKNFNHSIDPKKLLNML